MALPPPFSMLTVGELAGLDLGSDLVVLSACNSLGGGAVEGDWLYGLTRAFLVAGSSGVVCTTSKAADGVAAGVVLALYSAVLADEQAPGAPLDVSRALRQAKRAFLKSPKYAHPSSWAPWVYHGRVPAERRRSGE